MIGIMAVTCRGLDDGCQLAFGWLSVGGMPAVDRLRTDEQIVGGPPVASDGGPPCIDSGVSFTC